MRPRHRPVTRTRAGSSSARTLLDAARELDLLYVPTRYPNGLASGTPSQAFSAAQSTRAFDLAARLIDATDRAIAG
jgi:HEPN domain-containing protein